MMTLTEYLRAHRKHIVNTIHIGPRNFEVIDFNALLDTIENYEEFRAREEQQEHDDIINSIERT